MRALLLFLVFLVGFSAQAQNPGGVGVARWYIGSVGVSSTTNGAQTFTWDNQAAGGNNAFSGNGSVSYQNSTNFNINFNPVLFFNGSSDLGLSRLPITNTNFTLIAVGQRDDNGRSMILGDDANAPNFEELNFGYFTNTRARINFGNQNLQSSDPQDFNSPIESPYILQGSLDQSVGKGLKEVRDGNLIVEADTRTTPLGGFSNMRIGSSPQAGTDRFNGTMAEILVFTSKLTEFEQQRVHSYLAIKYGIQLAADLDGDANLNELISGAVKEGDYVASDGTTLFWDYDLFGATYFNNIAGIARDDGSGLMQLQSKSASDGALVSMGRSEVDTSIVANSGTIPTDKMGLLWGHNAGSVAFSATNAPSGLQTLDRIWRVNENNNLGTVRVQVPASTSALTDKLPAASSIELWVSIDDDFSTGYTSYPMTLVGTNWEVDVDFTHADYFTFAIPGTIISSTQRGNESGTVAIEYTITLGTTNSSGSAVTYDIADAGTGTATSGSDYTAVGSGQTVSIADNAQTTTFTVSVLDDALNEGTETVDLVISNSSDPDYPVSTSTATGFITDDESGPGGVNGGNLGLWLKANVGAGTVDGSAVNTWEDQGSNQTNATSDGNPPTYHDAVAENINFNPVLSLDGADDRLVADMSSIKDGNNSSGRFAIFGVGLREDNQANQLIGSDNFDFNNKFHFGYNGNTDVEFDGGGSDVTLSGLNGFDNPSESPFLIYGTNTPSGRELEELRNANLSSTSNGATGVIGGSLTNYIGSLPGSNAFYNGRVTEIITFEDVISDLEKLQVYSYLGIKYGLQLTDDNDDDNTTNEIISGAVREGDYVASDGSTVIWNYQSNTSTYFNNVAGIGRDDRSDLSQKQSKSAEQNALVSIGLGELSNTNSLNSNTFSADLSFLLWGNNNGSIASFTATGAPANAEILARTWRVEETGTVGTVRIQVPASTSSAATKLPAAGAVSLLQDADGDFTSGATTISMEQIGDNWEADVDFNDGDYFTFAEVPNPARLVITQNGAENGTVSIEATVILDGENVTGSPVTFDFDDLGTGSATSGSDYTAVPGAATITVANGDTSGTITIAVIDDGLPEGNETVDFQISNPSTTDVTITQATATANILDNDIGPGGVSGNLNVWLRADKGTSVTVNNTDLTTWTDQTGLGHDATQDGNAPTYLRNAIDNIHFNPTLDFDGTDDRLVIDLDDLRGTTYTLFAVGERDDATTNHVIGSEGGDNEEDLHFGYRSNNQATLAQWANDLDVTVDNHDNPSISPFIIGGIKGPTFKIIEELRNGGYNENQGSNGNQLSGTKTNYIGDLEIEENYNGRISEVIAFTTNLDVPDRQKVYTYLCLKYGILMTPDVDGSGTNNEIVTGAIREGDYVASDNTVVWDYAARSATYFNNVAGIGRDDIGGLDQRQAKSVHDGSLLTIGLADIAVDNLANSNAFTADVSYMIWGHNNGALTFSATGAPANKEIIARTWQIEETGTVGTVKVRVPANTSSEATKLPTADLLEILQDADGDFTTGATATSMTLVGDNWEVDIDLNDGDYITFAEPEVLADLSVQTNGSETGPTDIELLVTLSQANNTGSPITFDINDLGTGTATSGVDYTAIGGSARISVANGASTGTFTITVLNDGLSEGTEDVEVNISNPSASFVTINTGNASPDIVDDDVVGGNPGGIANDLVFWLRADNGTSTTTDGADVNTWTDFSGNNNGAAAQTDAPVYEDSSANYNPTVDFSGSTDGYDIADDADINISGSGGFTAKSYSVVFKTGSDITTRQVIYEEGGGTNGMNLFIESGQLVANIWNNSVDNDDAITIQDSTTYLFTFVFNGSASRWDGYLNGSAELEDANVFTVFLDHSDNTGLGSTSGATQYPGNIDNGNNAPFRGQIMEMAYYSDRAFSAIDRNQIEDYLALKYGLDINQDISATDSSVVWGESLNGVYVNDVTFIGRDDDSGLNQRQSISEGDSAVVTMALGSVAKSNLLNPAFFNNDLSFLGWGHNGGDLTFTNVAAPDNQSILGRVWRVQETGAVDSVIVSVPSASSSRKVTMPETALLNLFVDDDGNFTSGTTIYPMTLNGADWEVKVPFNSGQYFSFGAEGAQLFANESAIEGSTDLIFTLSLPSNNNTGSPITYEFDDLGTGTATVGSDYTAVPGGAQITVPVGEDTATFTITVLDDNTTELAESIDAQISNPSNSLFPITKATATGTITDNEITNPGGILGSDFWFRADRGTGTTVDGTSVDTWEDQSGSGNDADEPGANQGPNYESVVANFNPALFFGAIANSGFNMADDAEINTGGGPYDEKSFSVVFKAPADITSLQTIYEQGGGGTGLNIYIEDDDLNINLYTGSTENTVSIPITASEVYVATFVYDGANTNLDLYLNGTAGTQVSNALASINNHGGDPGIGRTNGSTQFDGDRNPGGDEEFQGHLMEHVYFNELVFTATERSQVETYLAIKHGLTLSTDYTASDGTTIVWDNSANTGYNNNITGVAQDTSGSLLQKQSKAETANALVTLGKDEVTTSNESNTSIFGGDKRYFLFGDDEGTLTFSNVNAPAAAEILGRTWKVENTNNVSSVFLQIPASTSSETVKLPSTTELSILIDNDDDFSNGGTAFPLTLNGNNWEGTVSIADGQFFTFSRGSASLFVNVNGDEGTNVNIELGVALSNVNNSGAPLTFELDEVAGGSATSGVDYVSIPANAQISVANGQDTGYYTITIIDDGFVEAIETVNFAISDANPGGVAIVDSFAIAAIQDNDIDVEAPGGVFTGLTFWLKADTGTSTTVNGASIADWIDVSGNGNDAEDNGADPLFVSNATNFNPAIDFGNSTSGGFTIANDDAINSSNDDYAAKSYTIAFTTDANVTQRQLIYEQGGATNGLNMYILNGELVTNIWNNSADNAISIPVLANTTYVVSFVFDGSNTRSDMYVNGALVGSDLNVFSELFTHTGSVGIGKIVNDTQFDGGVDVGSDEGFLGEIMEIAYYNEKVYTTAERNRIEAYLGIKYGVSISADYITGDGLTTVWDTAANNGYNNDITGIADDNRNALEQKQSISSSSDGFVTIGLGSIETDNVSNANTFTTGKDYLIWGNNGLFAKATEPQNLEVGKLAQLQRKWKIIEFNTVGTVQLAFDKDSIDAVFPVDSLGEISLRIADDEALTTNLQRVLLSETTINGNPSYVADYDFNGTKYFTIEQDGVILWTNGAWRGGSSVTNPGHPTLGTLDTAAHVYVLPLFGDTAEVIEPIKVDSITLYNEAILEITGTNCLTLKSGIDNRGGDLVFGADVTGFSQYFGDPIVAKFQQYVDDPGWHLIASPVSDGQWSDFTFLDSNGYKNHPIGGASLDSCDYCNLWFYDPSTFGDENIGFGSSDAFGKWFTSTDENQNFAPDRGWNIYLDTLFGFYTVPFTIQIEGTLNNGTFNQTVNENNAGWNLVANPYPSVLDWDAVDDDLAAAGIANGYHIWNEENTNYAVYANGAGTLGTNRYIAPFQGYYVQTSTVGAADDVDVLRTLTLENSDRPSICTGATSQFFKTSSADQVITLRTMHLGSKKQDETIIRLSPEATLEFNPVEDMHKLLTWYSDAPSVYNMVGQERSSIQSRPLTGEKDSVQIGIKTKNGSQIRIEAIEPPAGYTLYLEDVKTSIWHRINNEALNFTHDARFEKRFWLHFSPMSITPSPWQEGKPYYIYQKDDYLYVRTNKSIIDANWFISGSNGNVVLQDEINNDGVFEYRIDLSRLSPGAYFFVIQTFEKRYVDKLIKL